MRRPLKMALRFTAIVAALTLIPMAFGPADPVETPYLSALSDLSVGSALAAKPTCRNKGCVVKRGKNRCGRKLGSNACRITQSGDCMEAFCN